MFGNSYIFALNRSTAIGNYRKSYKMRCRSYPARSKNHGEEYFYIQTRGLNRIFREIQKFDKKNRKICIKITAARLSVTAGIRVIILGLKFINTRFRASPHCARQCSAERNSACYYRFYPGSGQFFQVKELLRCLDFQRI